MKRSKDHFKATMVFDDESIRMMFRAEYYTYERIQLLTRLCIGIVFVLLSLSVEMPTIIKALCLMAGCWLVVSRDFPSKVRAERVLERRGGVSSRVECRFSESGIDVDNGAHFDYAELDRLIEDGAYCYIFKDRQSAVMVPKDSIVPNDPERFQRFISLKTGKDWRKNKGVLLFNWKDLRQMVWDKARPWIGQ